jgi:broad specificity phosphatase PhoE
VRGFRILLERPEERVLVVSHGITVTCALAAARGEPIPLTFEGANVPRAVPYPVSAEDLVAAVGRLDAYASGRPGT